MRVLGSGVGVGGLGEEGGTAGQFQGEEKQPPFGGGGGQGEGLGNFQFPV